MKLERILIATDFSEPSIEAARWATRHFAPDAAVTLLHVIQLPRVPGFLKGLFAPAEAERTMREHAASEVARVARALAADRFSTEVRTGDPAEVITEEADALGVDVVVVGEHGTGRGRRGRLGSTAERLIGAPRAPVLLARGMPPGPPRHLLAAVDESEFALPVLRWAGFLSGQFQAGLVALHVTQPRRLYGPVTFAAPAVGTVPVADEVHRRARHWLERSLHEAGVEPGMADVRVREGEAAFEIPEEAERIGADLILMGSRGAGAVRRLLLGSTASMVLRSASCPVLVVPGEA